MLNYEWLMIALLFVIISLFIDKMLLYKDTVNSRDALKVTCFWIAAALIFNCLVYYEMDEVKAAEFFSGYLMEMMLSIDNLVVFMILFQSFSISHKQRHFILLIGTMMAIIIRLSVIIGMIHAVAEWEWVYFIVAWVIILTAVKLLCSHDALDNNITQWKNNIVIKIFSYIMPFTSKLEGNKFFIYEKGRWHYSSMLILLIVILNIDLIFAMDSIPVMVSITNDVFIIFFATLFSLLSLRAMFLLIDSITNKIAYFNKILALLLLFIGAKLLFQQSDTLHINTDLKISFCSILLPWSFIELIQLKNLKYNLLHISIVLPYLLFLMLKY